MTAPNEQNVRAAAAKTVDWLTDDATVLAVPVYQRNYRWDTSTCSTLLDDIRAVGAADEGHSHFIGSILVKAASPQDEGYMTLIDGQQRVTTLMLLVAALRDSTREPARVVEFDTILSHPHVQGRARLEPHKSRVVDFEQVVQGQPTTSANGSPILENYEFFRDQVADDTDTVWRGLRRLEHVTISLLDRSNAQQTFESLNSMGVPLRNDELIHNYVHMGMTHREQVEVEEEFWVPIEENTGEAIEAFFRDYLVLHHGRPLAATGNYAIYQEFKDTFGLTTLEEVRSRATEWRAYSEAYRYLLDPAATGDDDLECELGYAATFGGAMRPLLMQVLRDLDDDAVSRSEVLQLLEQLQSLYLRQMVVGRSRDHLAPQLCRSLRKHGYPLNDVVRKTPTDERIRQALRNRRLPHAGYVLRKLEGLGMDDLAAADLEIEHIFPQGPNDAWSPDGAATWGAFSAGTQALYKDACNTIGNLALLEQPLNAGASNKPFPEKKRFFRDSAIALTKALDGTGVWDLDAIHGRTDELTEKLLATWPRPSHVELADDEGLVSIFDVQRLDGPGLVNKFEYARFQGEIWEVRNVRELFMTLIPALWHTHREEIGEIPRSELPIEPADRANHRYLRLDDHHHLNYGWWPGYLLESIQFTLQYLNLEDDLSVRLVEQDE